jgi:hypothetical protein
MTSGKEMENKRSVSDTSTRSVDGRFRTPIKKRSEELSCRHIAVRSLRTQSESRSETSTTGTNNDGVKLMIYDLVTLEIDGGRGWLCSMRAGRDDEVASRGSGGGGGGGLCASERSCEAMHGWVRLAVGWSCGDCDG